MAKQTVAQKVRKPHRQPASKRVHPLAPLRLETTLSRALAYRQKHGECVICTKLARELRAGERIVELTEEFALFVPFAARSPLEQWLIPSGTAPASCTPMSMSVHPLAACCSVRSVI